MIGTKSERAFLGGDVDRDDRDRLAQLAAKNERSVSAELRLAVKFYLEHKDGKEQR